MTTTAYPKNHGVYVKGWVAGRYLYKEADFIAKLGDTAWRVWKKLCVCRDEQGFSHVTHQTLARKDMACRGWEKLTAKQIKHSLVRLRSCGLVETIRWVPSKGTAKALHKKRIYGAMMLCAYRGDMIAVPGDLHSRIDQLKSRGGKREGAGRKPSAKSLAKVAKTEIKVDYIRGPNQSGLHRRSPLAYTVSSFSKEKDTPCVDGENSLLKIEVEDATTTHLDTSNSTIGSKLTTNAPTCYRNDERLFDPMIPAFPGPSVVRPAQIPAPPRLDKNLPEHEQVETLRAIMFGVYRNRYERTHREWARKHAAYLKAKIENPLATLTEPKEPSEGYVWQFNKIPRKSSKTLAEREAASIVTAEKDTAKKLKAWEKDLAAYDKAKLKNPDDPIKKPRKPAKCKPKKAKLSIYEILARGASLMIEHDLQPALWVAWSVDNYYEHAGSYAAKTAWVFDETRITKWRALFRGCVTSYSSGTLMPGVSFNDLKKRYFAMRRDLLGTDRSVEEIVDEHFPGRLYRVLVANAKTEASEKLSNFRFRIARGEYLWD